MNDPVYDEFTDSFDCDLRFAGSMIGKAPAEDVTRITGGRYTEALMFLSLMTTPSDDDSMEIIQLPWVMLDVKSAATVVCSIEDSVKQLGLWFQYLAQKDQYQTAIRDQTNGQT